MQANARPAQDNPRGRPRILLVEDESVIAMDMAAQLDGLGFQVVGTAANARRAQQLAHQLRPDAVLMDICIQGACDGIEAARLIREDLDAPVIFLTAYGDEGTIDRAKQVSPHGYLIKPARPEEMRAALEVALQRQRMESQLRESRAWLDGTLRGISDAVVATDGSGTVRFINHVAEQLTGCLADAATGRPVHEVCRIESTTDGPTLEQLLDEALAQGTPTARVHAQLRGRDGRLVPVDVQAAPARTDDGHRLGGVLVLRDATERLRAEAQLRALAQIDPLTGLHNRAALPERLDAMIATARRQGNQLAVLFIDLDHFKQVNDDFGHEVGDAVLVEAAKRLRQALRTDDFLVRLGGDEFVLVAGHIDRSEAALELATRLLATLRPSHRGGDALVRVTASIGIALFPDDSLATDELLRHADAAMYQAKRLGGDRCALHPVP
ncbi:MAG TPA: diguanylate cyclase [Burkholderiaceae bacterium]|nr:diguanylate cyclase [Burkholderiaceae bacterium]